MKDISNFLRSINEENQLNINYKGLEEALKSSLVKDKGIDIKIGDINLPASYFNSGLVGTIIEYIIVQDLGSVDVMDESGKNKLMKFTLDESDESIVYGHPDLHLNGILVEIKANRNLKKDGIKFTKEQLQKFTKSTPIIWVGYEISGNSIKINDIKVRSFGELTNGNQKNRIYNID